MAKEYIDFDIKDELLQDRVVFLIGEITDELVGDVKAKLLYLNGQNHKEISLYIDSPGGDAYSAFGLVDLMHYIESPITTICIGQADSAAAVILSSGDKRCSFPHTEIMIHEVGQEQMGGKTTELKNQVSAINKANDMMSGILAQATGKNMIQVRSDIKNKDFYMTPKEAIDYGLLDEILSYDKIIRNKKRKLHPVRQEPIKSNKNKRSNKKKGKKK